jgi:hypothetical protein
MFIECDMPCHLDNRGLRWDHFRPGGPMYEKLKRVPYDKPPWSTRFPKLAGMLDDIPRAPLGNALVRNLSYKSKWVDPEEWCRTWFKKNIDREYIKREHNFITDEDPGFVDAAKKDFRLKDDAIVYKKIPGFERIPFEKMGLYDDEYRVTGN